MSTFSPALFSNIETRMMMFETCGDKSGRRFFLRNVIVSIVRLPPIDNKLEKGDQPLGLCKLSASLHLISKAE
jgi:hypothetical protein